MKRIFIPILLLVIGLTTIPGYTQQPANKSEGFMKLRSLSKKEKTGLAQPQTLPRGRNAYSIQGDSSSSGVRVAASSFRAMIPPKHRTCFTVESENKMQEKFSHRLKNEKFEELLSARIAGSTTVFGPQTVYRIPVIVHVIHNGEPVGTGTNISREQVLSQFDALNEDFRKLGAGRNNHPSGADIQIEFIPALFDPEGKLLEEPGIDRQFGYSAYYEYDPIELELKPNTIWDPDRYFNIWTVNFGGGMAYTLGYAQFPSMSGLDGLPEDAFAETDGVVIGYKYFGRTGNVEAPFNMGRTTTHEVGHWLGLRHIWGDGDCTVDDYCADTPNADGPNQSCEFRDSCPGEGPDMIENYMDYSDDPCMNIFTIDQRSRMRTVLEVSPRRNSLIACQQAAVAEVREDNMSLPQQWFEYTASATEVVRISSVGTTTVDTKVSLYFNCNGLPANVSDNVSGTLQSELTIALKVGETVKILWKNQESQEPFSWSLSIETPELGAACEIAATALPGVNTVPLTDLKTYWFKYTTYSSNKNLVIDGNGHSYDIYRNRCDKLNFVKSGDTNETVYGIKPGEPVFIAFNSEGGDFNWSMSVENSLAGETCAKAVTAVEGQNVIPHAPPFEYWYTYTMPYDGELSIRAGDQAQGVTYLSVFRKCGGNAIAVATDTQRPTVSLKLNSGELIRILWDGNLSAENYEWYLEATPFTNGEVCSAAKPAQIGINHTDGAPQWFSYTTTQSTNLKITSVGHTDIDTQLMIKRDCNGPIVYDNDGTASGGNYFNQGELVLHGVDAGETFLIGWSEKWSYEGFDWTIEEVAPLPGDNCQTAKWAVVGHNTVDLDPEHKYFGDIFWTKFTVPASGKKITAFADKPVDMAIYSHTNCETFTYISSGQGKGSAYDLEPGTEIIIIWDADFYVEDFTWELSVENVAAGDNCMLPSRAIQGTNRSPFSPHYYDYIMANAGSLKVTKAGLMNEPVIINVSRGCSYEEIMYAGYDTAFVSGLSQGDRVLITLTTDYPFHGVDWNLQEIPQKTGDICADPLPASYGLNHAAYASSWFTYTVETTGKLRISSRAFTFTDTDLYIYDGCNGNLLAHSDNVWEPEDFTLYFQSEVLLDSVIAGQTLLINWGGNYSFAPFSWEINNGEIQKGDTCEEPLQAAEGLNNANKSNPSWFTFTMPHAGSLIASSLGYTEAWSMIEIYDGCNGNLLASDDGSDGSAQSYVQVNELAAGQTVLIKCYGQFPGYKYTYDWRLFVGDPDPGLFCQYPAQAQVGVNVTPTYTSESFWYTFTMPENNKKLVISRLTNPLAYYRSVGVISDCSRTQIYGYGEDGIEITGLAAGETVLIFWSDLATGQRPQAEWNLSISDPGIGDACENSKEALPGLNYCSGAPTWYSYTLPRTGNIRLSSKETVWYADTNLEVYDGCNGSLIASNDNLDESNLTSEALIENVEAGQTIWIRWVTNHPFQTPFDWKLTVEGVVNSAPVLEDVSFHIVTTPTNGQILGVLLANDADNDALQYRITHGNEDGVFELTSTTGVLSFADVSKIPHNGISRELEITVTDKIAITTAMAKIDVITSFPGDENEDITVFPNPTTDCIYVRVPAQIDSFYCTLVDVNGKPVKTFPLNEHKLSVPGIASGNYFIKVHSSSRVDVVRVVVVQ